VPQVLSGYRSTVSVTARAGKQFIGAKENILGLLANAASLPISTNEWFNKWSVGHRSQKP
jgi:hypothetical protein